ncbi:hypothetical protein [Salinispora arenicola]|uniref:hypothetical protein n=1 Tax=Salinispora arenicola TaxID=168697 RepID=UPI0027DAC7C5|nr:hypothetical protein [Salinispora arenicola]
MGSRSLPACGSWRGRPRPGGTSPRLAVLPGVFVIEAAGQALALAVDRAGGAPTVLRRLRSVRFLAPFLDGDELTLRLTTTPQPTGWLVRGEGVRADGVVAARLRAEFGAQEQAHACARRCPGGPAATVPAAAGGPGAGTRAIQPDPDYQGGQRH